MNIIINANASKCGAQILGLILITLTSPTPPLTLHPVIGRRITG